MVHIFLCCLRLTVTHKSIYIWIEIAEFKKQEEIVRKSQRSDKRTKQETAEQLTKERQRRRRRPTEKTVHSLMSERWRFVWWRADWEWRRVKMRWERAIQRDERDSEMGRVRERQTYNKKDNHQCRKGSIWELRSKKQRQWNERNAVAVQCVL